MEETVYYEDGGGTEKVDLKLEMRLCKPDVIHSKLWSETLVPIFVGFEKENGGAFTTYDIALAIGNGTSLLYVGHVDGEFAGLIVVELYGRGSSGSAPNVWISYIVEKMRGSTVVLQGAKYIEEQMVRLGATTITAIGGNESTAKLFEKIGFERKYTQIHFVKKLGQANSV